MVHVLQPTQPLIDPIDGVQRAVEGREMDLPLLFLMVTSSLATTAAYARFDASSQVQRGLEEQGELSRMTEQEVINKITTAERIFLVAGVAKGIFLSPLTVLLLAVVLKLTGWLIGRKAVFAGCFTAASVAMLPAAVYWLITAVVSFRQLAITPAELSTLVPSNLAWLAAESPRLARALSVLDFFNLWSATLLGLGFSAASGMSRPKGVGIALLLYGMYGAVFLVALPGLS